MDTRSGGTGTTEHSPTGRHFVGRVEQRIWDLLERERDRWVRQRPELAHLFSLLEGAVLAGGKRLRPAFCYWGYVGAGGQPGDQAVVDAGAALELLHAFALVHDDVMDGSDLRRGRPALHRRLTAEHRQGGLHGDPERYGTGMAVLVGDLAFVYADVLMGGPPAQARWLWQELRLELTMGQHVDMLGASMGDHDADRARWVMAYKSGRYTVERPLHLGAALVGRLDEVGSGYSRFGAPLGKAFQLRDDMLDLFGDPEVTGKPAGSDLREGKATLLLALAKERSGRAGASILARAGRPDLTEVDTEDIRRLLVECGAVAAVEAEIETLLDAVLRALDALDLAPEAYTALRDLAASVAWRSC